jgi:acyl-[acyl-carrier-protein]-phospholipid O-acyltransferase / long-chain-fatty-acid--[acyl-carrier-protein] ligase
MLDLLKTRRFAPLFWTQFFSAFNDNFLKNALVFLILYGTGGEHANLLVTLAGAVFIAPFFLLSGLGGELADRFDKARIAQRLKGAEILAAALAVAGFAAQSVTVLFVALFLFGVIAALFGPIKYGILPDHLHPEELPGGNALVEGATFAAILAGTIIGGIAVQGGGSVMLFAGLIMAFAAFCYGASLMIPQTGAAAPDLVINPNIFASTAALLRDLRADLRLWHAGIIVSIFWMVGAVVMSLMPALVKTVMGGSEGVVSLYLAIFALSIAIGSGLGSFLCAGRIVLLPVPVAGLMMGGFALHLSLVFGGSIPVADSLPIAAFFARGDAWPLAIDLAGLAIAGGIFIVPSFAAAQAWAPKDKRARVIAAINVLNAAFMVAGALGIGLLQASGLSFAQLFLVVGLVCIGSALWIFRILPTNPLRDSLSILLRTIYRLEVHGLENIEKAGPNAIFALNHVSFLDGAIALALLDRDPVFAVDHTIARQWWVKPFLKLTRAMPLDPTRPLATRALIQAVRAGESLVIFPEGRLTVTGSLMKVYDGAGLIAEKSGVKLVPIRIEGPEATIFSRLSAAQVRRRWFPKFRITVLEPVELAVATELRGKARRQAAGAALYGVMSEMIFRTSRMEETVFEATVRAIRLHGKARIAVEDPVAGPLSGRRLLVGARVLGARLMPLAPEGQAIGLMLPNANAAAVALLGLMSANRVPAMINFSAGIASIRAACQAADLKTIVTARGFIEKARLGPLVEALGETLEIVYLEDIRAGVSRLDMMRALLSHEKPLCLANAGDRAAILFTSGSEGVPKGVVLSHRNMLANTAQAAARIDFGRQDKVFNVLPVFHSFGLTVGLVLPLVSGVPVYLYPSPLHYRIVPEMVYASNATILFGTDTFLTGYARAAHPYDFRSLRYVLSGAEPVKETTRRTYMEKFGLRILEGYGVTETAPVLAINTPMFNRFGTVGRIMPGMETRLEAVPGITEGGRLWVRGPNVMMGYLRSDNPGVLEPLAEGWHDTGDIVTIDAEGFVTIKGRARRFAKIAGEMISLAAVEALASACWPTAFSAAASLPDAKKGEKLVLLTQESGATRAAFQGFAKARGASDLMIPAEVIVVEAIPVLGSGKLDLAGVAELAKARAAS